MDWGSALRFDQPTFGDRDHDALQHFGATPFVTDVFAVPEESDAPLIVADHDTLTDSLPASAFSVPRQKEPDMFISMDMGFDQQLQGSWNSFSDWHSDSVFDTQSASLFAGAMPDFWP